MRVTLAGKVSPSNLGGTSRPRRSSWGENLRYTSRFPNVSQIFKKSDFLKKISQNLDPKMEVTPKSRSTWHDAEVPTLAGPGPYLARANSRAQCQGPYNFGGFFGRAPCRDAGVWQSRLVSVCAARRLRVTLQKIARKREYGTSVNHESDQT
jgi:hypothetical protein